jgi:hypothetical protein
MNQNNFFRFFNFLYQHIKPIKKILKNIYYFNIFFKSNIILKYTQTYLQIQK